MDSTILDRFFDVSLGYLQRVRSEERGRIAKAAELIADQIRRDRIVYVWGPGGHSNINAMEVFFRAGGLMHISAILDEGTLLSSGAMRSMEIERTPGYGRVVILDNHIQKGDLLIIANAYGINCACLDAALTCREIGATTIAVTSLEHSMNTAKDHPARHPSKLDLYETCDFYVDSKVPVGDAVVDVEGIPQKMGAVSTIINAYIMNSIMMQAAEILGREGREVPVWRSGNCAGGDEWNARFTEGFRGKVRWM